MKIESSVVRKKINKSVYGDFINELLFFSKSLNLLEETFWTREMIKSYYSRF